MPEPSRTIGPYRIAQTLGRGGMGIVYRAQHLATGETVALKTLHGVREKLLQSLRREIRALARLRHPDIVRIVADGLHDGVPWYAMELVEGLTLRRHVARLSGVPAAAPDDPTLLGGPDPPGGPAARWWTDSPALTRRSGQALPGGGDRTTPDRAAAPAASSPPGQRPPVAHGVLPEVLRLVRRLCAPLAYLHGEGLVHRDLKPHNILVRDGNPVLVDFGLILRFTGRVSREALEVAGEAVGTAAFMAPEQVRGELVDARADLYALGCVLYELLTGRLPFSASSQQKLLVKHLETLPPWPSELVDGVPPELDALVLRLLAKRPRDRIGHADDVARALAAIVRSIDSDADTQAAAAGSGARVELDLHEKPAPIAPAEAGDPCLQSRIAALAPPVRPYLYRPGFTGREAALAQLESLLPIAGGAGAVAFVCGESGSGKTRLFVELAAQAQRRRLLVLTGNCTPPALDEPFAAAGQAGGPALQALRAPLQLIADRCRERGVAETERLLAGRTRLRLLARYEPALLALPEAAAAPRNAAEAHAAPLPPEAALPQLYTALAATLEALAEEHSVLLLLDDLQWADELTLGFLEFLLQPGALERLPMLVAGNWRTEETHERLRQMLESPQARHIELGRLEERALASMIGDMLALSPPPLHFARFMARISEGNPFFVAEYLRAAVEPGPQGRSPLLWRDERGRWQIEHEGDESADLETVYEALPLPHSLRELVGRRLEMLGSEALDLAEAAAVAGTELDGALLAAMLLASPDALFAPMQDLLARQILEEIDATELGFVHDKIRESAYERIPDARRRELHLRAARFLEARFGPDDDEHAALLGSHWDRAGDAARARRHYLRAARQAAARYAHREAERLYRLYLALLDAPSRESIQARNDLASDVLYLQGRNLEALAEHGRAIEEAIVLGDRAGEGRGLMGLGVVHFATSQLEKAGPCWERALGIFRELGDSESEGRALGNFALLRHGQGRLDEARSLYEQAIALHRRIGDVRAEAKALSNLAGLYADLDQPEHASSLLRQVIEVHRRAGDRRFEGLALGNLAAMRLALGHIEEARELFERAIALLREVGDRRTETVFQIEVAVVERRRGSDPAAVARMLESIDCRLLELGDARRRITCLCERGHAALADGLPARVHLDEGEQLAAAHQVAASSQFAKKLADLRQAIEAAEAGERLFRGERLEALPAPLRRWLEQTGQLMDTSIRPPV
jgi:eukaryotic-like serine/threonine-protein kinase